MLKRLKTWCLAADACDNRGAWGPIRSVHGGRGLRAMFRCWCWERDVAFLCVRVFAQGAHMSHMRVWPNDSSLLDETALQESLAAKYADADGE